MSPSQNNQWWDYVAQDWIVLNEPQGISFDTARRLVSQQEAAQQSLEQYRKLGYTPYLAMLTVLAEGNR